MREESDPLSSVGLKEVTEFEEVGALRKDSRWCTERARTESDLVEGKLEISVQVKSIGREDAVTWRWTKNIRKFNVSGIYAVSATRTLARSLQRLFSDRKEHKKHSRTTLPLVRS